MQIIHSICPACRGEIQVGVKVCRSCGAVISADYQEGVKKGNKVLLVLLYLLVWPWISFLFVGFIYGGASLALGCGDNGCLSPRSGFVWPAHQWLVVVTILAVTLFAFSFAGERSDSVAIALLAKAHKYACFLSPGFIGEEGFGWVVPYLLAVPFSLGSPKSLQGLTLYFCLSWVIVLVVFLLRHMWAEASARQDD